MPSIVLELQSESLNPSVATSDLLRKALVIASKLRVPEFSLWIENELGGYYAENDLPRYRTLRGEVRVQDPWGRWIPVHFKDEKFYSIASAVRLLDSVAELEALWERTTRQEDSAIYVAFTADQEAILAEASNDDLRRHAKFIRLEDIKGVLDIVKTEILKWSLKLEHDGILGEGVTFSQNERQRAASVHYTTNFYSAVGNVAQNGQHFSQTAHVGLEPVDLARLVMEFTHHLAELGLSATQEEQVQMQLATLKAQICPEPDAVIVRQAARTLRNVTEGAIGSLLATGIPSVWQRLHEILIRLSGN